MASLRVSIAAVKIRNYRSCKKTSFTLDPNVTALIGPNGAGKTNILQALKLLASNPRRYIEDGAEGAYQRSCSVEVDFSVRNKILKYRGKFSIRPGENNTDIVADRTDRWNFAGMGLENKWFNVGGGGNISRHYYSSNIHHVVYSDSEGRVIHATQGAKPSLYLIDGKPSESRTVDDPKIYSAFMAVKQFMTKISYYSASGFTNPTMCPTSFEIGDNAELRRTSSRIANNSRGGMHLTFIQNLYSARQDNSALYERYLSVVGKTGAALIEKINWKTSTFQTTASEVQSGGRVIKRKTKRTLVIPTVLIGGDELSFNQLSEGTFRALAIIFYILRGERELLLLEEPEVCVHYGLLDSVISVIRDTSEKKQIVLSTHSDAVIDMLTPDNLRLTRSSGSRGTVVDKLSQRMSARSMTALRDYLESTGSLGEYWKHSGFN